MNSYLDHFFGPQADYYVRATEELQEGKVQFNGAAFFAGILWMGYRKMYLQAFITAAIILSESVAEHYLFPGRSQTDNSSAIVALLMNAIIGFISNQMYVNFATRQVSRILTQHPDAPEPQLLDAISRRGGVAWYGPFVVLLTTVVAAVLVLSIAEMLGVRME
jgi:hypothetical protein